LEAVRVYVPKETHRRVKLYATRENIGITQAYGKLINELLTEDGVLKEIIFVEDLK